MATKRRKRYLENAGGYDNINSRYGSGDFYRPVVGPNLPELVVTPYGKISYASTNGDFGTRFLTRDEWLNKNSKTATSSSNVTTLNFPKPSQEVQSRIKEAYEIINDARNQLIENNRPVYKIGGTKRSIRKAGNIFRTGVIGGVRQSEVQPTRSYTSEEVAQMYRNHPYLHIPKGLQGTKGIGYAPIVAQTYSEDIPWGGGDSGSGGSTLIWGGPDYPNVAKPKSLDIPIVSVQTETFNDAFARARKFRRPTFWFNGKKYNTNLGGGAAAQKAGAKRQRITGITVHGMIPE